MLIFEKWLNKTCAEDPKHLVEVIANLWYSNYLSDPYGSTKDKFDASVRVAEQVAFSEVGRYLGYSEDEISEYHVRSPKDIESLAKCMQNKLEPVSKTYINYNVMHATIHIEENDPVWLLFFLLGIILYQDLPDVEIKKELIFYTCRLLIKEGIVPNFDSKVQVTAGPMFDNESTSRAGICFYNGRNII